MGHPWSHFLLSQNLFLVIENGNQTWWSYPSSSRHFPETHSSWPPEATINGNSIFSNRREHDMETEKGTTASMWRVTGPSMPSSAWEAGDMKEAGTWRGWGREGNRGEVNRGKVKHAAAGGAPTPWGWRHSLRVWERKASVHNTWHFATVYVHCTGSAKCWRLPEPRFENTESTASTRSPAASPPTPSPQSLTIFLQLIFHHSSHPYLVLWLSKSFCYLTILSLDFQL